MDGFDFDYWKNLAEQDPAGYFRARDEVLRECIAEHPGYLAGLAELQGHIDATRVLAGSPLQASRALFGLMEDQLHRLGGPRRLRACANTADESGCGKHGGKQRAPKHGLVSPCLAARYAPGHF